MEDGSLMSRCPVTRETGSLEHLGSDLRGAITLAYLQPRVMVPIRWEKEGSPLNEMRARRLIMQTLSAYHSTPAVTQVGSSLRWCQDVSALIHVRVKLETVKGAARKCSSTLSHVARCLVFLSLTIYCLVLLITAERVAAA